MKENIEGYKGKGTNRRLRLDDGIFLALVCICLALREERFRRSVG